MPLAVTVRRSAYFDSVALMRVAEQARQLAGVTEVSAVMGTPANRAMLAEAGMLPPVASVRLPGVIVSSPRSRPRQPERAISSISSRSHCAAMARSPRWRA